jgi:hypothetical protein
MTQQAIADFLTDHPQWAPRFSENRGRLFVDGFTDSGGNIISLRDVQRMLAACPEEDGA